jgi:hypothetical protein
MQTSVKSELKQCGCLELLHVHVFLRLLGVSAAAWRLHPGATPSRSSRAARTLCPKPGANTPASSSPPWVSITFAALRSPCTTPVAQHSTRQTGAP